MFVVYFRVFFYRLPSGIYLYYLVVSLQLEIYLYLNLYILSYIPILYDLKYNQLKVYETIRSMIYP